MKTTRKFKEIKERLGELNEEALLADCLESALIGVGYNGQNHIAVYDEALAIKAFMRQGMSSEEAMEWYEYNTLRSLPYYAPHAPIFVTMYENLI